MKAATAAALLLAAAETAACGGAPGWVQLEAAGHHLAFVTLPTPPPVGRHFRLEVQLCATQAAVRSLRVDADMPAHRHGMNYRATVKSIATNRWLAEGLLFHMPGRWRFVFELEVTGGTRRLTHEVDVE